MGILIKPLVCVDHNYVFNVFTCINNLIESEILYFRKTCKTYNKTYDNTPRFILHVIVSLILKFRTNTIQKYLHIHCFVHGCFYAFSNLSIKNQVFLQKWASVHLSQ